jgi:hypothetical protein
MAVPTPTKSLQQTGRGADRAAFAMALSGLKPERLSAKEEAKLLADAKKKLKKHPVGSAIRLQSGFFLRKTSESNETEITTLQ